MKVQRSYAVIFTMVVGALVLLSSCTYTRLPQKLYMSRTGDTLTVALDEQAQARWDPERDSLVVECKGCEAGRGLEVEHFQDHDFARYEIAHTEGLRLTLYSMGKMDTVFVLSGNGDVDTSAPLPALRRIPTHRRRAVATGEDVSTKRAKKEIVKDVPKDTPKDPVPEKVVKKSTTLKVTAVEGVAIYRDKSKKEVLKILPQGATLTLLAREGDLYSVAVGDGEGFVEAEAVQLQ
jgi:hypothetical protein